MDKQPPKKPSRGKRKIASRPFPNSERKIPSRKISQTTTKIQERQSVNEAETSHDKPIKPALLARPLTEADRRERVDAIRDKLKLKPMGESE
jgi:hypothetical protein